ncbi:MAG: PEP-CTERM sorting domain-containing protein [Candidatus Auribacterota bacterium]
MKKILLTAIAFLCITPAVFGLTLFSDDFNDNSIDYANRWNNYVHPTYPSGGSVVEQNQRLEFTMYGANAPRPRRLETHSINASGWETIDFSGHWMIPATRYTAEFDISIIDANNPSLYIAVTYQSWGGPYFRMTDAGVIKEQYLRATPSNMVSFSLRYDGSTFEYWENDILVDSITSTTLAGSDSFIVRIGGWDYSAYPNQYVYFDDVAFSMSAVPEPATCILLLSVIAGLFIRKKM